MTTPTNGLIVFDSRMIDTTYLADIGIGSTDSTYEQSTTIPGTVENVSGQRLLPLVSGSQVSDLSMYIATGGSRSNQIVYSVDDGLNWRGYHEYGLTGYGPVLLSGTEKYQLQTIPDTQELLLTYVYRSTPSAYSIKYDATTKTTNTAALISAGGAGVGCTVVQVMSDAWFAFYADTSDGMLNSSISRDQGTTWELMKSNICDVGTTATGIVAAYLNGGIILLVESGGDIVQWASSNYGSTFTEISTISNAYCPRIAVKDDVAYVAYINNDASDDIYLSTIETASENVGAADTDVLQDGVSGMDLAFDGSRLRVYYEQGLESFVGEWDLTTQVFTTTGDVLSTSDTVTGLVDGAMATSFGIAVVVSNTASTTTTYDEYAHILHVGGPTTIEVQSASARQWIAIDRPSSLPYWTFGGSGTPTFSAGTMQIATSGAQHYYTFGFAATKSYIGAQFAVSDTQNGNANHNDACAMLTFTDIAAANTYKASIRFTQTGYVLSDEYGSTHDSTSLDMSVFQEFLFWVSEEGKVSVAHKLPTDVDWILTTDNRAMTANVGATNATVQFGTMYTSTTTTSWSFMNVFSMASPSIETDKTNMLGLRIDAEPMPLIGLGNDAGGEPGYVRCIGGPSFAGEIYSIPLAYQYRLSNALVSSHNSEWRSTSLAEQSIVFDLGAVSFVGNGLGLYIANSNFKTAYLEYYSTTTSTWTSCGIWNAATGFGGVAYISAGDIVRPTTGTAGSRYIGMNELTGSWIDTGSARYRIAGNTGGFWSGTATTKPTIYLDTSIGVATGTIDICSSTALALCYPTTTIQARYWRVRIPTQVCVDTYFKASIIGIGRIQPFGQAWGWGWGSTTSPNYRSTVSQSGVETRKKLGESRTSWTFAFTDGLDVSDLRTRADAEGISVTGGVSLGTASDVSWMLQGIEEETDGWTVPVVACSALGGTAGTATTITDPTLMLFGFLGGSISTQYVAGDEGTNEIQRIESVTVDEVLL